MSIEDAFYKKKLAQMAGGGAGPDPAAAALSLLGQQENEQDKALARSIEYPSVAPTVAPLPGYPPALSSPAEPMPDLSSLLGVPEPTPESDAALIDSLTGKAPPIPEGLSAPPDAPLPGYPSALSSPADPMPNLGTLLGVPEPTPESDAALIDSLAGPTGRRSAPARTAPARPTGADSPQAGAEPSTAPATTTPAPSQPQAEADATPPAPASGQGAAPEAQGAAASEQPDGVPRDRSVQENLDEIRVQKDKEAAALAMTQPQSTGDAKRDFAMFDSRMRMLDELRGRHSDTRTRLAITALMESLGRTAVNYFRVRAGQPISHGGRLTSLRHMDVADREYRQAERALINEWAEVGRAAETERTRQQTAERQARNLELSERRTIATEQRAATEAERRAAELALSDPSSRASARARDQLREWMRIAAAYGMEVPDIDLDEASANDMRAETASLRQRVTSYENTREGRRARRRRLREEARLRRSESRRGGAGGGGGGRVPRPAEGAEEAEEAGIASPPQAASIVPTAAELAELPASHRSSMNSIMAQYESLTTENRSESIQRSLRSLYESAMGENFDLRGGTVAGGRVGARNFRQPYTNAWNSIQQALQRQSSQFGVDAAQFERYNNHRTDSRIVARRELLRKLMRFHHRHRDSTVIRNGRRVLAAGWTERIFGNDESGRAEWDRIARTASNYRIQELSGATVPEQERAEFNSLFGTSGRLSSRALEYEDITAYINRVVELERDWALSVSPTVFARHWAGRPRGERVMADRIMARMSENIAAIYRAALTRFIRHPELINRSFRASEPPAVPGDDD